MKRQLETDQLISYTSAPTAPLARAGLTLSCSSFSIQSSSSSASSRASSIGDESQESSYNNEDHYKIMHIPDHNIGLSLKRVKISTSPGELRLMKDIDQLISEYKWRVVSPCSSGDSMFSSDGSKIHHIVSPQGIARIERDPVDPLRLRFCISSQQSQNKEWTFLTQIPRMYPHSPPLIYHVSQRGLEFDIAGSTRQASIPPPSHYNLMEEDEDEDFSLNTSNQYHEQKQLSMKIVISQNNQMPEFCKGSKCFVFYGWNPVSTLHDLIHWLEYHVTSTWKQPTKHLLFQSNRFDLGYDKEKLGGVVQMEF